MMEQCKKRGQVEESYLLKMDSLKNIAKKYNLGEGIANKINECIFEMKEFSLKILFVGSFSAGKSALINTILNRDLLVEDQKPETALASEIVFDDKEYIELFNNNGTVETCPIVDIDNYDSDQYKYLRYHIKNEYLRKCSGITLVDMPGFNSGIEKHNKAILQYAAQGNAYVLVVDCEDGELKASVLEFIEEIKQYDNNVAIVISKSDKKPQDHINIILEKIKETASSVFNKELVVISTSKFDEGVCAKMDTILEGFNSNYLFEQKFKPQITEIGSLCHDAIENVIKTDKFDVSEIEQEIYKRQKVKINLTEQLNSESKKISAKMKNQVKPSILADMHSALLRNSAAIASSIIAGKDAFSRTVNNILRPVLIASTHRYSEECFNELVEQMDMLDCSSEKNLQETANDVSEKFKEIAMKVKKIASNSDKGTGTYKGVVGALAITTSFVAPWMEVLVLFLPDILRVWDMLNKEHQMNKLKLQVENEIIPDIISKMEEEIQNSLQLLEEEMICEIEGRINTLIDIETEALSNALNLKNSKKMEYDLLLQDMKTDLKKIESII